MSGFARDPKYYRDRLVYEPLERKWAGLPRPALRVRPASPRVVSSARPLRPAQGANLDSTSVSNRSSSSADMGASVLTHFPYDCQRRQPSFFTYGPPADQSDMVRTLQEPRRYVTRPQRARRERQPPGHGSRRSADSGQLAECCTVVGARAEHQSGDRATTVTGYRTVSVALRSAGGSLLLTSCGRERPSTGPEPGRGLFPPRREGVSNHGA